MGFFRTPRLCEAGFQWRFICFSPNTWARWAVLCFFSSSRKYFSDDRFASHEKEEFLRRGGCVCVSAFWKTKIYVRTQSSPSNQLIRKLHLLNAKQITDKLLNASAVIKVCRITCEMRGRSLNYVTLRVIVINLTWIAFQISFDQSSSSWTPTCALLLGDVIARRPPNHFNELPVPVKCFSRTFYWIVGHLCGSSCCWNCCSFLHIRFCKMRKAKRNLSKNSWISRELFFF